jgi:two-component system CheB/CheR fusion protein
VYAQVDRQRLSQVIINLLNNAVKYSPQAKQVLIAVSIQEDKVIISIQDFGIGIAKSEQSRIFERFYQANADASGLGIGLYVSAEIIKQHQGRIWVESQKGRGSTFYVALPVITPPTFSPFAQRVT